MAAVDLLVRKYIFFGLAVVFCSCEKTEERPADILSHEEMVRVLAEVYIAEQKVTNLALGVDSAQAVFEQMKGRVFEAAGVPDSTFKKSFDFYMNRPKELEQIYSVLVDSLQLREQRVSQ
jgi:hypothetical protein